MAATELDISDKSRELIDLLNEENDAYPWYNIYLAVNLDADATEEALSKQFNYRQTLRLTRRKVGKHFVPPYGGLIPGGLFSRVSNIATSPIAADGRPMLSTVPAPDMILSSNIDSIRKRLGLEFDGYNDSGLAYIIDGGEDVEYDENDTMYPFDLKNVADMRSTIVYLSERDLEGAVEIFADLKEGTLETKVLASTSLFMIYRNMYLREDNALERGLAPTTFVRAHKKIERVGNIGESQLMSQLSAWLPSMENFERMSESAIHMEPLQFESIKDYFSMISRPGMRIIQDTGDTGTGKTYKSLYFANIMSDNVVVASTLTGGIVWTDAIRYTRLKMIGPGKSRSPFTYRSLILADNNLLEPIKKGTLTIGFAPTNKLLGLVKDRTTFIFDEFHNGIGASDNSALRKYMKDQGRESASTFQNMAMNAIIDAVVDTKGSNSYVVLLSARPGEVASDHPWRILSALKLFKGNDPSFFKSAEHLPDQVYRFYKDLRLKDQEKATNFFFSVYVAYLKFIQFGVERFGPRGDNLAKVYPTRSDEIRFLGKEFLRVRRQFANDVPSESSFTVNCLTLSELLSVRYFATASEILQKIGYNFVTIELSENEYEDMLDQMRAADIDIDNPTFTEYTTAINIIETIKAPHIANTIMRVLRSDPNLKVVVFVNRLDAVEQIIDNLSVKPLDKDNPLSKYAYKLSEGGSEVYTLYGDVPGSARAAMIARFNEPNTVGRVFVATVQVGGESINLDDRNGQFPRRSIIFPSYHFTNTIQAAGRTTRSGTKSKALNVIPILRGVAIEKNILENMWKKDLLARAFKKSVPGKEEQLNLFTKMDINTMIPLENFTAFYKSDS